MLSQAQLHGIAKGSNASQDKFELEQLLKLLVMLQPEKILEIGVHRGGFLETMRSVFPDAVLVGIENDVSYLEFHDFNLINGTSQDLETRDKFSTMGQFDFLFIDGDHHYADVRADYEIYGPLVRPGGIIAFHDTMRLPGEIEGVEVHKLFEQLAIVNSTIEFWGGRGAPGTGVVFK